MDGTSLEQELRAVINGMRAELDEIIDRELARWVQPEAPIRSVEPADSGWGRPYATSRTSKGNGPPDSAVAGTIPTARTRDDHRGEAPGEDDSEDAVRRLDALALRLEGRLKRSKVRENESPGSGTSGDSSGPPAGGGA